MYFNEAERNFIKENEDLLENGNYLEFLQKSKRRGLSLLTYKRGLNEVGVSDEEIFSEGIIPNGLFYENEELFDYVIPSNIKEVGPYAFYSCKNLEKVVFQEGLKEIGGLAFYNCVNLKSIVLPDSLIGVGPEAFLNNRSATELVLGKNLKHIGEEAFMNCKSLVRVRFPRSIETILNGAFAGCSSLKEVFIPDTYLDNPGIWLDTETLHTDFKLLRY